MSSPSLHPSCPTFWSGRTDGGRKERFFQHVELPDSLESFLKKPPGIAFIGFASDVGVFRNQGRPGAVEGPYALREALAKLPYTRKEPLYDLGNITPENNDLESAQKLLGEVVSSCVSQGHFPIVLGGGHEVAWGHFQGLAHQSIPSVVNFDAHYDLRPLPEPGKGSSGTSFTQMADYCRQKDTSFQYACLGAQPLGNTPLFFEMAQSMGVTTVLAETFFNEPHAPLSVLREFLGSSDKVQLTLCLDVFAEAFAPGVSAPQALGLSPHQVLPLLRELAGSGKVMGFDVAELSPPYDPSGQTARLAAQMVAHFVMHWKGI